MGVVDSSIPKKHIDLIFNPKGDGNCGFRSLAYEIYSNQDEWKSIKQEMLDNLTANQHFYLKLFTQDNFDTAKNILICRDEEVSVSFYFTFPEHCRIACETFRRTIVFFSSQGNNITFVPLLNEPVKVQPVFLQLSGLHFYLVKIKQGARYSKYLPILYPGHEALCKSNMIEDYSRIYF